MPSVDDYLDRLDEPRPLLLDDPSEEALLALLILVAFADGVLQEDELQFLLGLLPEQHPEALRSYAREVARNKARWLARLSAALPSVEERWKGLRFAARMAWKDGELSVEEGLLLDDVAQTLGLPTGAVDEVLLEMAGRPGEASLPREQLRQVLRDLRWDVMKIQGGALSSADLLAEAPAGGDLVTRIGLDGVEVMGLFTEGLLGRFIEGVAFLPWESIVTYTRVPVFGASVSLHTEDGRSWTLVDSRLRGVGMLLDHLFGVDRPVAEAPEVRQLPYEP
ncbi:MAG: TerB family tellurite resistance protein [Deltaproteobacteria bacterium]|nr:TerB family tellurite resistance protein [Deltaproteobacteria bacterium]